MSDTNIEATMRVILVEKNGHLEITLRVMDDEHSNALGIVSTIVRTTLPAPENLKEIVPGAIGENAITVRANDGREAVLFVKKKK